VIRWKKDGQFLDLASSQRIVILPNGHLRILELLLEDSGAYQCTATNMAGTRESRPAARIQVLSKSRYVFVRRSATIERQGCQMVFFQAKNPIFCEFWRDLQWKMLVYFVEI
jgi:hypothetical protein